MAIGCGSANRNTIAAKRTRNPRTSRHASEAKSQLQSAPGHHSFIRSGPKHSRTPRISRRFRLFSVRPRPCRCDCVQMRWGYDSGVAANTPAFHTPNEAIPPCRCPMPASAVPSLPRPLSKLFDGGGLFPACEPRRLPSLAVEIPLRWSRAASRPWRLPQRGTLAKARSCPTPAWCSSTAAQPPARAPFVAL